MFESRLIETIKILDIDEFQDFKKLLEADFFYKGIPQKEVILLLDYILLHYPMLQSEALSKTIVQKQLFKDKEISLNKLEKIMSNLLAVLEQYIAVFLINKSQKDFDQFLNLAKFYRERGAIKRSETFLKQAELFLTQQTRVDFDFYQNQALYYLELKANRQLFKSKNISLKTIVEYDNIANAIKKVEFIAESVYDNRLFTSELMELFNELAEEVSKRPYLLQNNLFRLYYLALLMFEKINTENYDIYNEFHSLLISEEKNLTLSILTNFYTFERVFLSLKYNENQSEEITKLIYDVYKDHLEKDLLLINGVLLGKTAINLVTFAFKQKDSNWLFSFLKQWESKIGDTESKIEVLNYCWATYYFLIKDYNKAETLLSYEFTDIGYLLYSRRMRLKILYEKREEYLLSYEINAFKLYVYRQFKKDAINKNIFEFNNHFIDCLKQIINLRKNKTTKQKKEKLYNKVTELKVASKEWLLEKIATMKLYSI